jgi:hypothetical protein
VTTHQVLRPFLDNQMGEIRVAGPIFRLGGVIARSLTVSIYWPTYGLFYCCTTHPIMRLSFGVAAIAGFWTVFVGDCLCRPTSTELIEGEAMLYIN